MISFSPIERQTLLKRLLPALAIVVVYFTFIAPRVGPAGAASRAGGGEVSPEIAMMQLEQEKQALYREIASLQQQGKRAGPALPGGNAGVFAQPGYANQAIQRLTTLLAQHHARILTESGQELKSARETLPATVREIGEAMQIQGMAAGGSLWSIRFSAAYPDVARALEGLSRQTPMIIPVSLEMIPPEADGNPDWTVTIWVN